MSIRPNKKIISREAHNNKTARNKGNTKRNKLAPSTQNHQENQIKRAQTKIMFKYSIKRKQQDNTSEGKSKQTQYEANYMSKHPVSMQEEKKETRAAENYVNYSIK